MKQLILLRHAKSDWSNTEGGDFARCLSSRGKSDAPRMGKWLESQGYVPDVMVSSPAARTTETSELICEGTGYPVELIKYEPDLYNGSVEKVRQVATAQFEKCDRVIIVGHNPSMEQAVLAYCPTAKPFADGKIMPTCTAAVIEWKFGEDFTQNGALQVLMRPSELP